MHSELMPRRTLRLLSIQRVLLRKLGAFTSRLRSTRCVVGNLGFASGLTRVRARRRLAAVGAGDWLAEGVFHTMGSHRVKMGV